MLFRSVPTSPPAGAPGWSAAVPTSVEVGLPALRYGLNGALTSVVPANLPACTLEWVGEANWTTGRTLGTQAALIKSNLSGPQGWLRCTLPASVLPVGNAPWSVSLWAKVANPANATADLFSYGGCLGLVAENTSLKVSVGGSQDIGTAGVMPGDGQWHHYAVTFSEIGRAHV